MGPYTVLSFVTWMFFLAYCHTVKNGNIIQIFAYQFVLEMPLFATTIMNNNNNSNKYVNYDDK